ncbi:MAG: hypothetical protein BWY08_02236 [Bacteroidetes bacterium ADurb.Bin174]|jgi:hypothetical protein|nr:MAG: hypothetical protein BWY08_02236 [Bacteroidetes bacterium ADurb.Bin174]
MENRINSKTAKTIISHTKKSPLGDLGGLDDHIDNFIRKDKQEQVNPYLATRVLAKLEEYDETAVIVPIWKKVAVVASFALVIAAGFKLGSFAQGEKEYISININDAQLENLNFYTFIDHE